MGSWRCPGCRAENVKTPALEEMSARLEELRAGAFLTQPPSCPSCGKRVDAESLYSGRYDIVAPPPAPVAAPPRDRGETVEMRGHAAPAEPVNHFETAERGIY